VWHTALPVAASVSILLKVPVLHEVGACGWRENGVDLSGRHGDERKCDGETQHGLGSVVGQLGVVAMCSFELDVRDPRRCRGDERNNSFFGELLS
jgi:hypothetical protein